MLAPVAQIQKSDTSKANHGFGRSHSNEIAVRIRVDEEPRTYQRCWSDTRLKGFFQVTLTLLLPEFIKCWEGKRDPESKPG